MPTGRGGGYGTGRDDRQEGQKKSRKRKEAVINESRRTRKGMDEVSLWVVRGGRWRKGKRGRDGARAKRQDKAGEEEEEEEKRRRNAAACLPMPALQATICVCIGGKRKGAGAGARDRVSPAYPDLVR